MVDPHASTRDRSALVQLLVTDEVANAVTRFDTADWQQVVADAFRHGVAPLVWGRLCQAGCGDVIPAGVSMALRGIYSRTIIRNLRLYTHLTQALRRLEAQGVAAIVLKGAFLADVVYRDRGLRSMSDLDLLVRRCDLRPAATLLVEEGWSQPHIDGATTGNHALPPFTRDGVHLDLHWNIEDEASPFRIDVESLWERARMISLSGAPALALAPEDLLLHLCLHTSYCHGWLPFSGGLRHLWDIATTIRHYSDELNWEELAARANAWGIERCVWLALFLARELVGAPLPPRTLSRLLPHMPDNHRVELARHLVLHAHYDEMNERLPVLANLWLTKRPHEKSLVGRLVDAVLPHRRWLTKAYPSLPDSVAIRHAAHLADLTRELAAVTFSAEASACRDHELRRRSLIRWLESHADATGCKTAIVYREASIKDCIAVARVNVESWRKSFSGLRSKSSLTAITVQQRAALFEQRFKMDFYTMLVAEVPRQGIIGFVDVGEPRNDSWGCDAELYSIYVLKEFQSQGLGRNLFQLAIEASRARGRSSMYLIVLADSPYRMFYRQLGGDLVAELPAGNGNEAHAIYAWRNLGGFASRAPVPIRHECDSRRALGQP